MRAHGRDITEFFGYAPDDISYNAKSFHHHKQCPFVKTTCTKCNSDQTIIYGVCSVSRGVSKEPGNEVIVCPKRLYSDNFKTLRNVVNEVWGDHIELITSGTHQELRYKALNHKECIVAFGQSSGNEVSVPGIASLSMDWVLQRYVNKRGSLEAVDFVGIEVQSIDITGNYRDCHSAYEKMKNFNESNLYVPNSGHGLNWANVHKRLIPQIIRKGSIYREINRCRGFYFILPDAVFKKFEDVLPRLERTNSFNRENLSVHTYNLEQKINYGQIRQLEMVRSVHFSLESVIESFSRNNYKDVSEGLDERLKFIL